MAGLADSRLRFITVRVDSRWVSSCLVGRPEWTEGGCLVAYGASVLGVYRSKLQAKPLLVTCPCHR